MSNFDVFISYPHEDKASAEAVCSALETSGIKCWIAPRDIAPGVEWATAIVQAIDGCRVVVLIYSSKANDSHQVHREIDRAFNRSVPVLPIRLEDVKPADALAFFLGSVQYFDALTPPLDDHLAKLASAVNTLLSLKPQDSEQAKEVSTTKIPTIHEDDRTG